METLPPLTNTNPTDTKSTDNIMNINWVTVV